MVKADRVTAAILIAVSVITVIQAQALPSGEAGKGPGPGAFPLATGILLCLLAVALLAGSRQAGQQNGITWPDRVSLARVLSVFVLLVAYVAAIGIIGFLPGTVLFVLGALRILGYKNWLSGIIFSLALGILTWQVFIIWLKVALPASWLGI